MAKRQQKIHVPHRSSIEHASQKAGRKVKITFRLPNALSGEVADAMKRDGYSPKKKSVWIEESLLSMVRNDPDLSESLIGDKAQGLNTRRIVVALSAGARQQLKDTIVRLRLQMPMIEGVQSVVLRAAMRFRVRHPESFTKKE